MSSNATCSDMFTLRGDLGAPSFLPWIARHAGRLGIIGRVTAASADEVSLLVEGPPDLVDAMELGVSLGPIDVWVESIKRERLLSRP
ncbi:acylphosphatase [Tabrizicola sp. J26]|nr:acylphosphatase [Tabrizicola rongguiensis]